MKIDFEELSGARGYAAYLYNSLPEGTRRSVASPIDRLLENELAIREAENHLANLKRRRKELQKWMIECYRKTKQV